MGTRGDRKADKAADKTRTSEPKGDKDQPRRWKGDEVEDRPGDEAERAADRAEGNQPVRADAEDKRVHNPRSEQQAEDPRRRPGPRTGDPDADIADAAEEHRARAAAGERPPRGKF